MALILAWSISNIPMFDDEPQEFTAGYFKGAF